MEGINKRHNSPYDRGNSDSWYRRPPEPHKIVDGKVVYELTEQEWTEYWIGYEENELWGHHKDWGD